MRDRTETIRIGADIMNDTLALLIVLAVIIGAFYIPRMRVFRKCRCGTQYCIGCGTKRSKP